MNRSTSSILSEHKKIIKNKYILAIINYLSILASTVITLLFMQKKGAPDGILTHIFILVIVNFLQIVISLLDYVTTRLFGVYVKPLSYISWLAGGVWVLVWAGAFVAGTLSLGSIRIDLLIIAAAQFVTAIITCIVWASLDRKALDAMINKNVREDEEARGGKAKRFAGLYVIICVVLLFVQAGTLFAYKIPPKVYDLFDETRALQYELNETGDGYVVVGTYSGTSSAVNIPAMYNGKPVTGIATDGINDSYGINITSITIGTPEKQPDGTIKNVSYLESIESGAIYCNYLKELNLPLSVLQIGNGAIESASLEVLQYESKASFSIAYLENCRALKKIVMAGNEVGNIRSLDGMSKNVNIEVSKDIYNSYREKNLDFMQNFLPSVADDEFYINFYTNCDYYIESVFGKKSDGLAIGYEDLKSTGKGLTVDTLAYIKNNRELGTNGIKPASAFRGWYFDPEFKDECLFTENQKYRFSETVSLYAKWLDEYVVTFDWGTYKPDDAVVAQYWTSEDSAEFPTVTDRLGYDNISWHLSNNDNNPLYDSTELAPKNTILYGVWELTKPTVDISIDVDEQDGGFNISHDKNNVIFGYDENRILDLSAIKSHSLEGVIYRGKEFYYTYKWVKDENLNPSAYSNISLRNVADAGEYLLTVTANSPYGEISYATSVITVEVNRKALDIGTAILSNEKRIYSGAKQTLYHSGELNGDNNISVKYSYYDSFGEKCADGEGVSNAGYYTVKAEFAKNNATEAANYAVKELSAILEINPKSIGNVVWKGDGTNEGWSDFVITYDGKAHELIMDFDGRIGNDSVELVYEGNTGTNADRRTARVTGINNSNYTLDGVKDADLTRDWRIRQKEVTVLRWEYDNQTTENFSTVYDGGLHSVKAIINGTVEKEIISFNYFADGTFVNNAKNAGSYVAKISGVNDDNYYFNLESNDATRSWYITRRELNVSFPESMLTYNGELQGINAIISNFVNTDASEFSDSALDFTGNSSGLTISGNVGINNRYIVSYKAVNAGTYDVRLNGLNSLSEGISLNYLLSTAMNSFVIRKKSVSFSALGEDKTYDGTTQDLVIEVSGIVASDLENTTSDKFTTVPQMKKGEISSNNKYRLYYEGKNAQDYSVSINAFGDTNYEIPTDFSVSFKINKKTLTVDYWTAIDNNDPLITKKLNPDSSNDGMLIYNYYGYTVEPVISGVADGEVLEWIVSFNDQQSVGNHYSTVSLIEQSDLNYQLNKNNLSWKINKRPVDFIWNPSVDFNNSAESSFIYDGTEKRITPDYELLGEDYLTLSYEHKSLANTDVGEYLITVKDVGNNNYKIGNNGSFAWKITQKTVTVEWSQRNDFVYNGTYQGPSFSLTGILEKDEDGSITVETKYFDNYTAYMGKIMSFVTNLSNEYAFIGDKGIAVDADQYSVSVVRLLKDGIAYKNYNLSVDEGITFEIKQKELTLSQEWYYTNNKKGNGIYNDGTEFIYNTANYELTRNVTGIVNRLGGTADTVYPLYSYNSMRNAGDYTAAIIGLAGEHSGNYRLPQQGLEITWSILPKTVDVIWRSPDAERIFSNEYYYQEATVNNGAATDTDGLAYSRDIINLIYTDNAKINAGKYTATASIDGNYVVSQKTQRKEWTISPRPVELNWSYYATVYDGTQQYPKASYFYNGVIVEASEYSHREENYRDVGDYRVTATKLNSDNFTLDTEKGAKNLYRDYEIAAREITLSWQFDGTAIAISEGKEFTYDGLERTVTAVVTNKVDGDSVDQSYSANTIKDANNYKVSVISVGNRNYKLNTEAGKNSVTFTVTKRKADIVWSGNANAVYDGSSHGLSATVDNACGNDEVNVTGYYRTLKSSYGEISSTANAAVEAGTYEIKATELNAEAQKNYYISGESSGSHIAALEIKQQEVNILWTGEQTATYDKTNHGLTATVSGVTDGKTVGFRYKTVGTNYDASVPYATNSGIYTVSVDSLDSTNYCIAPNAEKTKELNILPKTVTLDWGATEFIYDGETRTVAATVTNTEEGDTVAVNSYSGVIKSGQGSITNNNKIRAAGTYVITALQLNNNNYKLPDISEREVTVTITPQVIAVTSWSESDTHTYDGNTVSRKATITKVASDGVSLTYTYKKGSDIVSEIRNVGDYTITLSGMYGQSAHNYTLEGSVNTTCKLSVTPKEITLSWSENSFEYNGETRFLSATVNGTKYIDGSVTVTKYDGNGKKDSGSYVVTATELSSVNYRLPTGAASQCTLTITAAPLRRLLWSGDDEVPFDGSKHTRTAVPISVYAGDNIKFEYEIINNVDQSVTTEIIAAGSYTIRVIAITGDSASNYTLDDCENPSVTLKITPIAAELKWYNDDAVTLTYNGENRQSEFRCELENDLNLDAVVELTFYNATDIEFSMPLDSVSEVGNYVVIATLKGKYGNSFSITENNRRSFEIVA